MAIGWKLVYQGRTPPPGAVVRPGERLSGLRMAENSGHVKAVSEMTGDDLDPYLGRAFIGDGVGTALASLVGGSPATTYAENIGVMAATRVYSTRAYYIAAGVAILFGLVLYGMIGLLGAKIWIENRVNSANPVNLVPLAAGIIAGIGNLAIKFTSTFSITGIAAGTLIVIIGYHGVRLLGRGRLLDEPAAAGRAYEGGTMIAAGNVETPGGEVSPFRVGGGEPRHHPAGPTTGQTATAGTTPARAGEGDDPAR